MGASDDENVDYQAKTEIVNCDNSYTSFNGIIANLVSKLMEGNCNYFVALVFMYVYM
jgi:hypothetical protein